MNKQEDMDLKSLVEEVSDNDDRNVFAIAGSDFNLPLRIRSFSSAKDFEQFVKNAEKLVRSSLEYRLWIQYITDNMGHRTCALTKETMSECPVEVHHHPITLYTVVKSVVNKILSDGSEFSTFDIATKVIELHFQNKVGYVVLLSSLHSKYHSGFLNIPIEIVNGDYKFIMNNYSIEEGEYDKIIRLCGVHAEDLKLEWSRNNYPGINDYEEQLPPAKEPKALTA